MLRAGICDLGTCDLEMGWPVSPAAPPAGPLCGSPAPPTNGFVRPGKRDNSGHARPARRPACAQRRVGRPAARSARRAADLRRYLQADDDLPHLRPATLRRFPPGCRPFPAGGHSFPPRGRGISARRVPRVSPRVPWRYRRGTVAFPPGCRGVSAGRRARAAGRSRSGRPYGPGAGARRRPLPRRAIHFPAAVRGGTNPAVRPPAVSR